MDRKELVDAFGRQDDQTKFENFEVSTIKAVLQQLGMPSKKAKGLEYEYGQAFGFDWFNEQGHIDPLLGVTRYFNYNFLQLFERPSKHPVTEGFLEMRRYLTEGRTEPDSVPVLVVFKAYDHGRMIATNLTLKDRTHLHVAVGDIKYNITPFSSFFTERYGQPLKEDE